MKLVPLLKIKVMRIEPSKLNQLLIIKGRKRISWIECLPLAAGDLAWHRAAAGAPGRAAPVQRHCRAAPAPGRRERTDLGLTSGGLQRCSPQPAAATGNGQARRRRGRASEDRAAGDGRARRGSGERPNGPTGQGWEVGLTHFWAV